MSPQNETTQRDTQQRTHIVSSDSIKTEEVVEAIKTIKRGKSAGHDKVTPDMLENVGFLGVELLRDICNKAWMTGVVPEDWKTGIIYQYLRKEINDPAKITEESHC